MTVQKSALRKMTLFTKIVGWRARDEGEEENTSNFNAAYIRKILDIILKKKENKGIKDIIM